MTESGIKCTHLIAYVYNCICMHMVLYTFARIYKLHIPCFACYGQWADENCAHASVCALVSILILLINRPRICASFCFHLEHIIINIALYVQKTAMNTANLDWRNNWAKLPAKAIALYGANKSASFHQVWFNPNNLFSAEMLPWLLFVFLSVRQSARSFA